MPIMTMPLIIVLSLIFVMMFGINLLIFTRTKPDPVEFPKVEDGDIVYRETGASGSLLTNGLDGMGGASRCLKITVTRDMLILGGRIVQVFTKNRFGTNQIIDLKDIRDIKHESSYVIVHFRKNEIDHTYRITSANPKKLIEALERQQAEPNSSA